MSELTYEAALRELQAIVNALQEETLSVDDLGAKVSRAAELIRFCRERLRLTEAQIDQLFAGDNPSS